VYSAFANDLRVTLPNGTGLIAIMNGSSISIRNRLQMKFDYCLSCIHSWTSGTRVYDRSIGPTYGRR